jgi:hypothetical protein
VRLHPCCWLKRNLKRILKGEKNLRKENIRKTRKAHGKILEKCPSNLYLLGKHICL